MPRHIVVGNWKMNFGPSAAANFASQLREACHPSSSVEAWVAPPLVSLSAVAERLDGSVIKLGGQNVHWEEFGAFTGETSPAFLKELSCSFSIVGHSERRHGLGESCDLIARRTLGAVKSGLTAIVCVGESKHDRDLVRTEEILSEQLAPICDCLDERSYEGIVVAYEPVWAIGTGVVATISEIESAHTFIRNFIAQKSHGAKPPILYGGSVSPANFKEIIALDSVDGALVGGASLKVDQFCELVRLART